MQPNSLQFGEFAHELGPLVNFSERVQWIPMVPSVAFGIPIELWSCYFHPDSTPQIELRNTQNRNRICKQSAFVSTNMNAFLKWQWWWELQTIDVHKYLDVFRLGTYSLGSHQIVDRCLGGQPRRVCFGWDSPGEEGIWIHNEHKPKGLDC